MSADDIALSRLKRLCAEAVASDAARYTIRALIVSVTVGRQLVVLRDPTRVAVLFTAPNTAAVVWPSPDVSAVLGAVQGIVVGQELVRIDHCAYPTLAQWDWYADSAALPNLMGIIEILEIRRPQLRLWEGEDGSDTPQAGEVNPAQAGGEYGRATGWGHTGRSGQPYSRRLLIATRPATATRGGLRALLRDLRRTASARRRDRGRRGQRPRSDGR